MNLFPPFKTLAPSLSIPKPIVFIFKTLQVISYNLATYFSAKLFVTPFGFQTPKREQFMSKSAQKLTLSVPLIKKEIHILSYGYSKKKRYY